MFRMDINIRNKIIENETWFAAKDICNILGLKNVNKALQKVSGKWKKIEKIETNGGAQNLLIINSNGVKYLLQNCRSIHKDKIMKSLNIDLDIIYECKEVSYLRIISASFKSFSQIFQYQVNKYRIDLYFPDYKLSVEVDEFNHKDRCLLYEKERQDYLEKYLGCKFIRFNPDETNFNIGNIISIIIEEIYNKT